MAKKRIPQHFINELLARTDIAELIGHRIQMKKRGNNYFACCPFHKEKTPSFSVNPKKQIYHCFGCKASGNALNFLMEHDGMQFLEAVDSLASRAGMQVPREAQDLPSDYEPMIELMAQAQQYYQQNFKHHQHAIKYLKNRGLDKEIVIRYGIGYAAPGWDHLLRALAKTNEQKRLLIKTGMAIEKDNQNCYDRFRDRIMFPIRNIRGQVIGFGGRILEKGEPKYLNSPESDLFHKRSELYGLYEAREANRKLSRLLVVEGYMDVVALAQFGISYAVATLGTAATIRHIHSMLRYTSELVFCFDGDTAGEQAAWHALEIMLPVMRDNITIRFMMLPEQEDPDSLIRKIGLNKFEQAIENATSFSDFFYQSLSKRMTLDTMEHKAQFGREAMLLLGKMPDGILQSMMIEKLADIVNMSVEKLQTLVMDNKQPINQLPAPTEDDVPRAPQAKISSLMAQVLTLIVQQPHVAHQIEQPERLSQITIAGAELLDKVVTICRATPEMTTGALLAHFNDNDPEKNILSRLAVKELLIDEEFWANELNDFINRIFEKQTESEMDNLMKLAREQKLDETGKMRLMELLKG